MTSTPAPRTRGRKTASATEPPAVESPVQIAAGPTPEPMDPALAETISLSLPDNALGDSHQPATVTEAALLAAAPRFVKPKKVPDGWVVMPPPVGWYREQGLVRVMPPEEYAARQAALIAPFPADWIERKPQPVVRQRDGEPAPPRFQCVEGPSGEQASADGHFCGGYHARSVHLDYIGHAGITDRLVMVDPLWSWEAVYLNNDGGPQFNAGHFPINLTVLGVTRLGVGDALGKSTAIANKEVIGDAIRNAAMRFGVGTYLWAKSDRAAILRAAEPEAPALPTELQVEAALQAALEEPNPEQAIIAAAETLGGRDVLQQVAINRADGAPMNAYEAVLALLKKVRQAAQRVTDAPADEERPTPPPADAGEEPQAPVSAPVPDPVAQEAARGEQKAQQAAQRAQAAAERAEAPQRRTIAALTQEVIGQAGIMGVQPVKYTEEFLRARGVNTLSEVPPVVLQAWVLSQRPKVIDELEAQGRAAEAEHYRAAGKSVATWQSLTGTVVAPTPVAEPQPEYAGASGGDEPRF